MSSNEENKNQEANLNLDNDQNGTELKGGGRHCGKHRMWKFPFIVAAVVAIKSALVLLLWNALIPEVFHGPELNYLQAIELTLLVKILTGFGGGFRHRFGRHHHHVHHGHHRHGWGRHRERWMKMTPEEREKMRDEMRNRCRRR